MYKKLLEYNIFSGTKELLLKELISKPKVNIISGNPEVLYNGITNDFLNYSFTDKDALIIPDGVGTLIASRFYGETISRKIPGIEVMDMIVDYCEEYMKKIYLLGATEDVVEKCSENIKSIYKNIIISGYRNGFFDIDNCEDIIEDIKNSDADVIFVAMGAPRQETFIQKYKDKIQCSILMGVGGSFDVIAEKSKRAPKWMRTLGLEWFYRIVKEPYRIKRLLIVPKFIYISWLKRIK